MRSYNFMKKCLIYIFLPVLISAQKFSTGEIFRNFSNSVVIVEGIDYNNFVAKQGSGVAIEDGSIIVTNYHIFEGMKDIRVRHFGKKYSKNKIIAADPVIDLLIIKTDSSYFKPINSLAYDSLQIGDKVYAIGSPAALENSISDGIISGFRVLWGNKNYIQITAPIWHGSSGGAVINSKGKLIGISTWKWKGSQSLNFAIPVTSFDKMKFNCLDSSDNCYQKLKAYISSYNLVKSRQYKKALKTLNQYSKIYGSDDDIKDLFMETFSYMGINDSMIYYLNKNVKYLGVGSTKLVEGLKAYQNGDFFEAINYIISAINEDSTNGYFYYYLALTHYLNIGFTNFPVYKIISYLNKAAALKVTVAYNLLNYIEGNYFIEKSLLTR